jgi:hypothetical protein
MHVIPTQRSRGLALHTTYFPRPSNALLAFFRCAQTPRKCNFAVHIYKHTHTSTQPIARAIQYISRLLDSFCGGTPVFLLDCFACEREDAGFEAVVEAGGEDDVFVLVAVGELFVC